MATATISASDIRLLALQLKREQSKPWGFDSYTYGVVRWPKGWRPMDLATLTDVPSPSMAEKMRVSRKVMRLEKLELLESIRHTGKQRRALCIRLTAKGRELLTAEGYEQATSEPATSTDGKRVDMPPVEDIHTFLGLYRNE